MESYRYNERKKGSFIKYLVVIVITVGITLYINSAVQKAEEIDEFAERLSLEKDVQKENVEEFDTAKVSSYVERALQSTVGIGTVKPSGTSIFDVSVAEKWGLRNRNYCF